MPYFTRTAVFAASFVTLSACQMDTGTPPMDFAAMQAENTARTLAKVENCRETECERLNLDSGLLPDYSIVADMAHVTAFMASYTDFENLSDIAAMSQLRELHIGQTKVNDLSGLSSFPNLTLLHAQRIQATDFAAVGQLTRLEELVIGNSDLTNLGFVRGLSRLKTLNIAGSNVTNLSPLANLRALETLDMMDMDLPADLSPLLGLPNLKSVSTTFRNDLTPQQQAVVDQLEARGVQFVHELIMIVC